MPDPLQAETSLDSAVLGNRDLGDRIVSSLRVPRLWPCKDPVNLCLECLLSNVNGQIKHQWSDHSYVRTNV